MSHTPPSADSAISFEQRVATLLCVEQGLTAHRANTLAFIIATYATERAAIQPAGEADRASRGKASDAEDGEPSMLWDAEDAENCYGDGPEDYANNYASNCMMRGEEHEVEVLCAYRGSNRTMRIVVSSDDEAEQPVSWSWVDAARAQQQGESNV